MNALELVCLAIVLAFVGLRARLDPEPGVFLRRLLLLAAASFVAEDSCIRLYGFYAYAPAPVWTLWIDRVPVTIALIWPVVLHSALDLARRLAGSRAVPFAAAAIVLADASFIEPIAVHAGLWTWSEPGLLGVPPIGVLGWSAFALSAFLVLERGPDPARHGLSALRLLAGAPLGCHALLLALWWGGLRWVNEPVPSRPAAALVWAVSLALAALALRRRAGALVPRIEVLARLPAAVFFLVLLAEGAPPPPELSAFALAFVPPWLVLAGARRP